MFGNVSWGGDTKVEGVEHVEGSGGCIDTQNFSMQVMALSARYVNKQECQSIYKSMASACKTIV